MSSSHCQLIAALLFLCLQLRSICPVIEEEDLSALHVLGDPDPAALQEMTRIWHSDLFLRELVVIVQGAFLFNLEQITPLCVHYRDHVPRPNFRPVSWHLKAAQCADWVCCRQGRMCCFAQGLYFPLAMGAVPQGTQTSGITLHPSRQAVQALNAELSLSLSGFPAHLTLSSVELIMHLRGQSKNSSWDDRFKT